MTWMRSLWATLLLLAICLAFLLNIAFGSVDVPFSEVFTILSGGEPANPVWADVVMKIRFPQAVTALLAGAALSVAGLQMQTVFFNPLAGPSVLGVSSGAGLGVALLILLSGSIGGTAMSELGLYGDVAVTIAAAAGAMLVMLIIAAVAHRVHGHATLLIVGVMIGYIANAIIGVLKLYSGAEDVHSYSIWGLGSFSSVSSGQLWLFALLIALLLPIALLQMKTLNLLLLGENYAANLGVNVKRARFAVIMSAGLLVAVCTAFCGPISFIGLAVPHICRGMFRTADHRMVMPACILAGALLALVCNFVSRLPGTNETLPVNSVTSLIGAPVVIWVLFRKKR